MTPYRIVRIVAVLTGAALLYWLTQALHVRLYFALPAAIVTYVIVLVVLGLWLKVEPPQRR